MMVSEACHHFLSAGGGRFLESELPRYSTNRENCTAQLIHFSYCRVVRFSKAPYFSLFVSCSKYASYAESLTEPVSKITNRERSGQWNLRVVKFHWVHMNFSPMSLLLSKTVRIPGQSHSYFLPLQFVVKFPHPLTEASRKDLVRTRAPTDLEGNRMIFKLFEKCSSEIA